MLHFGPPSACIARSFGTRSDQRMPASTSTVPRSRSKPRTRLIDRMSSSVPPVRNCWPPMEWQPPAIANRPPLALVRRTASCTSATDRGRTTSETVVSFSFEWMSLTIVEGTPQPREESRDMGGLSVGVASRPVKHVTGLPARAWQGYNVRRQSERTKRRTGSGCLGS